MSIPALGPDPFQDLDAEFQATDRFPCYGFDSLILKANVQHNDLYRCVVELLPNSNWTTHNPLCCEIDPIPRELDPDFNRDVEALETVNTTLVPHSATKAPYDAQAFYATKLAIAAGSLPTHKYAAIQPELDQSRVLILGAHHGNMSSAVTCRLSTTSLASRNHYLAVRNSRGNPAAAGVIILDGQLQRLTKNLEQFLRYMRLPEKDRILWIREICIDLNSENERESYYNPYFQQYTENHSCGIVQMDEVMDELQSLDMWPRLLRPHEKTWQRPRRTANLPTHHPIHLGVWRGRDAPPLPHRYIPLDPTVAEIRLITLWCAEEYDAPLIANLGHTPLHGDVSFQALSYTWGDALEECHILLNGQTFWIRKNLDTALRDTRSRDSKMVLWIDAICIDQASSREKSRHIPQMHEIFRAADVVLVWLGMNDEVYSTALDLLEELRIPESRQAEWNLFDVVDGKRVPKDTTRNAEMWLALFRLLQQSYFRRLWIIQELAVASSPSIWSSGRGFAWDSLHEASLLLLEDFGTFQKLWQKHDLLNEVEKDGLPGRIGSRSGLLPILSLIHRLTFHREVQVSGTPLSFLQIAVLSRDALCADPRDKIYALLSLSSDCEELSFKPDYTKSTAETYMAFAKAYADKRRSLDIICASQLPAKGQKASSMRSPPEMGGQVASWCPDWRQPAFTSSLVRKDTLPSAGLPAAAEIDRQLYHAGPASGDAWAAPSTVNEADTDGGSGVVDESPEIERLTLKPFHFEGPTLICSGVVLDTIAHVSHLPVNWEPVSGPFQEWMDMAYAHCPGQEDEISSAFWLMMCGKSTCSFTDRAEKVHSDNAGDAGASVTLLKSTMDSKYNPSEAMAMTIKGRRMIVTEKGYMGLAPWYVKVGYELAILLSCSVPVILENIPQAVGESEPTLEGSGTRQNPRPVDVNRDRRESASGSEHSHKNCGSSTWNRDPVGDPPAHNGKPRSLGPADEQDYYFRGDCYVQGWMEGQMTKKFGETDQDVWTNIMALKRIRIV